MRDMPLIGAGVVPQTSLDKSRKAATDVCQDAWITQFQDVGYGSRGFFNLTDEKLRPLLPKYTKGGSWLPRVEIPALASRLTRCILNHGPVGEYYRRFNIDESHSCPCGVALQTRAHVLFRCPNRRKFRAVKQIKALGDLVDFLEANPWAFAFRTAAPAAGIG